MKQLQGLAHALSSDIRLGLGCKVGRNTLAYCIMLVITGAKSIVVQAERVTVKMDERRIQS